MNITELIEKRRTIRKFKQLPVSGELLEKYVRLASIAPSGANFQPLKYITVCSKEYTDRLFPLVKWAGYLAPDYNPKEDERPTAYIIVLGDSDIRENGYDMDVGAAVEHIILAALEDGIGSCWMGSVDRPAVAELFDIDGKFSISCVIAMGYPAEEPRAVEVKNGDIKYYLEGGTLCVPKRRVDEIFIREF